VLSGLIMAAGLQGHHVILVARVERSLIVAWPVSVTL